MAHIDINMTCFQTRISQIKMSLSKRFLVCIFRGLWSSRLVGSGGTAGPGTGASGGLHSAALPAQGYTIWQASPDAPVLAGCEQ